MAGGPALSLPCAALSSQKAHSRHTLCQALETVMLIHWVPSAVLAGSPIIVPFYWLRKLRAVTHPDLPDIPCMSWV